MLNPFSHADRVARVLDILEQDRELVAAETGNRHFGSAARRCRSFGGSAPADWQLRREAVAGFMAKAVVHELEPIEIDEEHREHVLAVPRAPLDRLSEAIEKQDAIRQAGERDPRPCLR